MRKYAWIGSGLAACIALFTLSACDDYEFNLEGCEEHWDCRTNFGIGYTCNDDGFCEEPDAIIQTEYCSNTSVNYPPEIFTSTSARRSITLGTIVDVSGQQLASAARIAMELSNIRGGIGGVTALGSYNFSVVSCVLSDTDAANERTVREVARFLRDEVRAEAVLIGLNANATLQAIQEVRDRDNAAGENGHTLIVSANDSTMELENRLKDYDQLWTMAASELSMLQHAGAQLILRRLHPYAMQFCQDDQGEPLASGGCEYETAGDDDNPGQTVPIESVQALLQKAYEAYVADHEDSEKALGSYRVENFLAIDTTSGQAAAGERRDAFEAGVDKALGEVRPDNATPATDFERAFETNILACGESCGPKQVQVELLKKMSCDDSRLDGSGAVVIEGCEPDHYTDLSAVLLLSDSSQLSQAFYRALLGANGADPDVAAERIAALVGLDDPERADTLFMMPAAGSSGSIGVFTYDFSSESYEGEGQSIRKRWFKYIDEGRIFGVRQTGNAQSPGYEEFRSAQSILVRENIGSTQHYITQAYDAVWLSMAAIAASVATLEQDPSRSAADLIRSLRAANAQKHSASLRKHFSGATPEELEAINVPRADKMLHIARNFIPSQWETIVDTRQPTTDEETEALDGFAYPVLQQTQLLTGASGELRFDFAADDVDDIPRKRGSYNYGIWVLATQDKVVAEDGDRVDLDERGCIVGMAAPRGYALGSLPDEGTDDFEKYKFVCAVEVANCTYNSSRDENEFCVPTHQDRARGYTFPDLDNREP